MIMEKRMKNWWFLLRLWAKMLRRAKLLQLQNLKEHNCWHCQGKLMNYNIFLESFFWEKKNEIKDYLYVLSWKS